MGKKGARFRPCAKCGETVNFVRWVKQAHRGNIWHWANEDGSHHFCGTGQPELRHLREIVKEQPKEIEMHRVGSTITGAHYKPDGCTCGLPPWELCQPDCEHAA